MFMLCTVLPKQIPCVGKLSWRKNPILVRKTGSDLAALKLKQVNGAWGSRGQDAQGFFWGGGGFKKDRSESGVSLNGLHFLVP